MKNSQGNSPVLFTIDDVNEMLNKYTSPLALGAEYMAAGEPDVIEVLPHQLSQVIPKCNLLLRMGHITHRCGLGGAIVDSLEREGYTPLNVTMVGNRLMVGGSDEHIAIVRGTG